MSYPISVLLVDDEGVFITILAEQLREDFGYQTDVAFSGQEAIAKLQSVSQPYDVVLLDYKMPEVTGLNVLQWMHEQKDETPVIMLTAAGSEHVAVEAMKLGAYDYLRKEQVDLQHLGIAVQSVYERHQFRIQKALEEERQAEIRLNREATERVRTVLNKITPVVNEAFASIAVELEEHAQALARELPSDKHAALATMVDAVRTSVSSLERCLQAILTLYQILYANHADAPRIEEIQKEVEEALC
jgi:DNA-binding response OmpR family regulator